MSSNDYFLDESEAVQSEDDIAIIENDIDNADSKSKTARPADPKTKDRIYQLQEERRMKKLLADDFDYDLDF